MKIDITIDTRGLDLAAESIDRLDKIVRNMAEHVQMDAKAAMTGTKSGRVYKRGKTKRGKPKVHRASAPGEAPARDTGNLANAIAVRQVGKLVWEIYVMQKAIKYAIPLEFGAPNRQLAPRPFLTPAVNRIRKPFEKAVEKAIFGGLF